LRRNATDEGTADQGIYQAKTLTRIESRTMSTVGEKQIAAVDLRLWGSQDAVQATDIGNKVLYFSTCPRQKALRICIEGTEGLQGSLRKASAFQVRGCLLGLVQRCTAAASVKRLNCHTAFGKLA
jgi:hypothetical protein